MTERTPDPWLVAECARGIGLLLALGLPFRPELESATTTAKAWAWAIANRTRLTIDDIPRVRAAFAQLAGTSLQWPTPAQLIAALPKREEPATAPKLTRADDSAERRALEHLGANLGIKVVLNPALPVGVMVLKPGDTP